MTTASSHAGAVRFTHTATASTGSGSRMASRNSLSALNRLYSANSSGFATISRGDTCRTSRTASMAIRSTSCGLTPRGVASEICSWRCRCSCRIRPRTRSTVRPLTGRNTASGPPGR
ncbi:hypothetical protein ACIRSS_17775 [Amycolatopsis sp. NPDC101161]|uniref:hypothetical protein n=1 Tax=Amycolatopsis sp. NPDC101161 TaxID=3363940 RepID=UPI003808B477